MVLVVLCFETLGLSLLRTDWRLKEWSIKGIILKCIIAGSSNGSRGRSEQIAFRFESGICYSWYVHTSSVKLMWLLVDAETH